MINRTIKKEFFNRLCGAKKFFLLSGNGQKLNNGMLKLTFEFIGAQMNEQRYFTSVSHVFISVKKHLAFIAMEWIETFTKPLQWYHDC